MNDETHLEHGFTPQHEDVITPIAQQTDSTLTGGVFHLILHNGQIIFSKKGEGICR